MGLAGFLVAFVSVIVLEVNGYEDAPLVVLGAALVAGTVVAIVGENEL